MYFQPLSNRKLFSKGIIVTGKHIVKVSPEMGLIGCLLFVAGWSRTMRLCLGCLSCCLPLRPHLAVWVILCRGSWHGEIVAPSSCEWLQLFTRSEKVFPVLPEKKTNTSGEERNQNRTTGKRADRVVKRLSPSLLRQHSMFFILFALLLLFFCRMFTFLSLSFSLVSRLAHTCLKFNG